MVLQYLTSGSYYKDHDSGETWRVWSIVGDQAVVDRPCGEEGCERQTITLSATLTKTLRIVKG